MSFAAKNRFSPELSLEQEWSYLTSETLAGERCILPLLEDVQRSPHASAGLKLVLDRQIKEEVEHVERYERMLGVHAKSGTGFEAEFARFVGALPTTTLKLFALQAMLEGVSLGAIGYRMANYAGSPSAADDETILREEQGHVTFGFRFLGQLKAAEGVVDRLTFDRVSRQALRIFAGFFDGNMIAAHCAATFGVKTLSGTAINASDGMRLYAQGTIAAVIDCKAKFLDRYEQARAGEAS